MNQYDGANNRYSREKCFEILKSKSWYNLTTDDLKQKLLDMPDSFQGFLNDLADREEKTSFYVVEKMTDLYWDDRYAIPSFSVKSTKDGSEYANSYVSWRKGIYHSIRCLLLIEKNGKINSFVVRRSVRFATGKEVYESIGSIYPPENIDETGSAYEMYIQKELSIITRCSGLKIKKLIKLGMVYPDVGMSDNLVKLITVVIDEKSVNGVANAWKDTYFNDKRYDYQFEIIPIDNLFGFLAKANDSFLLAIFGRLQALNVIKL